MILVVGLGNPGKKYEETRHNLGFMVIDHIVQQISNPSSWVEKFSGLYIQDHLANGETVAFLKPQTFMNESGISVSEVARYLKVEPENIWVIYDDVDIDLGKTRIRLGGSPAGHNGIKSIDQHLSTNQYWHIRAGIGAATIETSAYVTSKFRDNEVDTLTDIITTTASHIEEALSQGELKDQTF